MSRARVAAVPRQFTVYARRRQTTTQWWVNHQVVRMPVVGKRGGGGAGGCAKPPGAAWAVGSGAGGSRVRSSVEARRCHGRPTAKWRNQPECTTRTTGEDPEPTNRRVNGVVCCACGGDGQRKRRAAYRSGGPPERNGQAVGGRVCGKVNGKGKAHNCVVWCVPSRQPCVVCWFRWVCATLLRTG